MPRGGPHPLQVSLLRNTFCPTSARSNLSNYRTHRDIYSRVDLFVKLPITPMCPMPLVTTIIPVQVAHGLQCERGGQGGQLHFLRVAQAHPRQRRADRDTQHRHCAGRQVSERDFLKLLTLYCISQSQLPITKVIFSIFCQIMSHHYSSLLALRRMMKLNAIFTMCKLKSLDVRETNIGVIGKCLQFIITAGHCHYHWSKVN